ncbi:MAG: hypothetical protein LUC21_07105, partial [Oscillospiraceae bacterium]|nr:hypothetical protein [Oscillospiraceae bacterium]
YKIFPPYWPLRSAGTDKKFPLYSVFPETGEVKLNAAPGLPRKAGLIFSYECDILHLICADLGRQHRTDRQTRLAKQPSGAFMR